MFLGLGGGSNTGLPNKCEALSSNPSDGGRKREREREREREGE
jgi:hypothetical protein